MCQQNTHLPIPTEEEEDPKDTPFLPILTLIAKSFLYWSAWSGGWTAWPLLN